MTQRDDLYQEGLILADFVVNEFKNSPIVARILNQDHTLLDELVENLRNELTDHRQRCLESLRMCEFIESPDEKNSNVVPPASPSEVSRATLQALLAQPLPTQTLGKRSTSSSKPVHVVPPPKKSHENKTRLLAVSPASALARSGLFSGIQLNDDTSGGEESEELRLKPDKILESSFPVEIFGVLDRENEDTRRINRQGGNSRKRRRALTEGVFNKEGTFNAISYGGFIHLCGGMLEWPFRTAELSFSDFFQTSRNSLSQ